MVGCRTDSRGSAEGWGSAKNHKGTTEGFRLKWQVYFGE